MGESKREREREKEMNQRFIFEYEQANDRHDKTMQAQLKVTVPNLDAGA